MLTISKITVRGVFSQNVENRCIMDDDRRHGVDCLGSFVVLIVACRRNLDLMNRFVMHKSLCFNRDNAELRCLVEVVGDGVDHSYCSHFDEVALLYVELDDRKDESIE